MALCPAGKNHTRPSCSSLRPICQAASEDEPTPDWFHGTPAHHIKASGDFSSVVDPHGSERNRIPPLDDWLPMFSRITIRKTFRGRLLDLERRVVDRSLPASMVSGIRFGQTGCDVVEACAVQRKGSQRAALKSRVDHASRYAPSFWVPCRVPSTALTAQHGRHLPAKT